MKPLVEVSHLKKYFHTPNGELHAVDDVSFTIDKGTTLGVVGESGCGKSTLGRTMVRLEDPSDGEIFFEGQDIAKIKGKSVKSLRKDVQIIFQDPFSSLDPRMTVSKIIGQPVKNYFPGITKKEIEEKIKETMDLVGLSERFANSYPHELDGGRRQRIGIARALIVKPKFIVCDEPVSALDVSIQAQILNLLMDLQDNLGLTYMFITHDLSVVRHISSAICVMYLGCIVEKCEARELFKKTLHPYTKALLSAIPPKDPDSKQQRIMLKGEITSPINPPAGCRFAPRCNYATEKCFRETPVLKDYGGEHFVACHYVENINKL